MLESPFRYPGGKAKLFPFFADLISKNFLYNSSYCEPYAGGAGLALRLLGSGYVSKIQINDIDRGIYSAWSSIVQEPKAFCDLVMSVPLTVDEWRRQYGMRTEARCSNLELGFATFFLNRTNRSGIIDGAGPIGGYSQRGQWRIDARFNRERICRQILYISNFRDNILVTNLDAKSIIETEINKERSIMYIDPPYFVKGYKLYTNYYKPEDHASIRDILAHRRQKNWVLSYDDVPEIRALYTGFSSVEYAIGYSAGGVRQGKEVIYLSDSLERVTPPNLAASA